MTQAQHFTAHTTITEIIAAAPGGTARTDLIDASVSCRAAPLLFSSSSLWRAIELQARFNADFANLARGGVVPNLTRLKLFWLSAMAVGRWIFPSSDRYTAHHAYMRAIELACHEKPYLLDEPPVLLPSAPKPRCVARP